MAKNRLSKEKWQKWEERKRLILSYDFHLTDTSKEREERVDHARRDYAYFVETYFPHLCTDPETKQITKCGKFQLSAAGWLKTPSSHPRRIRVGAWPCQIDPYLPNDTYLADDPGEGVPSM